MLSGGGGGESRGGFHFCDWVTVVSGLQLLALSYQTASVYPVKVSDKLFLFFDWGLRVPLRQGFRFSRENLIG